MYSCATNRRSKNDLRKGISIVEFVGCLAALGGGVVLGSMYLGVDVKAMAVEVLERADISVPAILNQETGVDEEASAEESQPAESSTPSEADASDDADSSDGTESPTAESPATEDPSSIETEPAATEVAPPVLTEAEQLAATKACWLTLTAAMKSESTNRAKSIRDPGNWQLFDYLLHRKRSHAKVVETLEAIDLNGVDQRLQTHLAQVLTWHRAGEELFERAAQLLTDAPAGKLSGPFAQSWQSASTQHRMEEKLILDKHKAVSSYLEHAHKTAASSDD